MLGALMVGYLPNCIAMDKTQLLSSFVLKLATL